MAKDPIGKRPTPSVAKGKSPSYSGPNRGYEGKRGTKTPTGNRPVPSVAVNHPPTPKTPGPVKAPIKHTRMGSPNRNATTRSRPHSEGGGSY